MAVYYPRTGIFRAHEIPEPKIIGGSVPRVLNLSNAELLERTGSDCFICHEPLTKGTEPKEGTDTHEDVFPKWLQKHFGLGSGMINLLDGSGKKYRDVLVPCCRSCNNEAMSQVENRISQALKKGFPEFSGLRRSDLFLWAAKILYGLLRLQTNPRDPNTKRILEPILSPDVFDHLRLTMMLLNGFRKRVIIDAPTWPFSILLFHLNAGGSPGLNFNYRDSIEWPPALAIRLGSIGLIVSFEDFGYLEHWYETEMKQYTEGKILHPIQFSEIVARAFYQGGLCGFNCRYYAIEGVNDLWLGLKPEMVVGYQPDSQRQAQMIAECTGIPLEKLWDDKRKGSGSIIVGKDGKFQDIPFIEGIEYPL
jgi:hypothetical protein